MSESILTGLLHEELDYDGLIVTDALDVAGRRAPRAFEDRRGHGHAQARSTPTKIRCADLPQTARLVSVRSWR